MLYLCDYTIIKFTPLDRLYLNIIKICARLESASANCDPLHSTIKPASPRFCDRCRPLAFMNNKLVGERRFVQLFLHARSASKLWNSRTLSAYAYSVVSLSLSLLSTIQRALLSQVETLPLLLRTASRIHSLNSTSLFSLLHIWAAHLEAAGMLIVCMLRCIFSFSISLVLFSCCGRLSYCSYVNSVACT